MSEGQFKLIVLARVCVVLSCMWPGWAVLTFSLTQGIGLWHFCPGAAQEPLSRVQQFSSAPGLLVFVLFLCRHFGAFFVFVLLFVVAFGVVAKAVVVHLVVLVVFLFALNIHNAVHHLVLACFFCTFLCRHFVLLFVNVAFGVVAKAVVVHLVVLVVFVYVV